MDKQLQRFKIVSTIIRSITDLKLVSNRICLIVCNPYYEQRYELGDAVCNDSFEIAKLYCKTYQVFVLIDQPLDLLRACLNEISKNELFDFVFYYAGHGTQVDSSDGTSEEDGKDEAYVFKSMEFLTDDEFTQLIQNIKSKNKLVLSDCCHSGTIIDDSSDLTYFSGCLDSQLAIQLSDNGLFTKYLVENKVMLLKDIAKKITDFSEQFGQKPVLIGNRKKLLL